MDKSTLHERETDDTRMTKPYLGTTLNNQIKIGQANMESKQKDNSIFFLQAGTIIQNLRLVRRKIGFLASASGAKQ